MSNQWYPFFPGDYARDTSDLSMVEDAVYRRLLDHYYSTGSPLPQDEQRLYRICRAVEDVERQAVKTVVNKFFSLSNWGYQNSRADRQLVEMAQKKTKLSESGRRGAEKRWNGRPAGDGHLNGQANGQAISLSMAKPQPQPDPQLSPEPLPNPEPEIKTSEVGEADASQKNCDPPPDTGGTGDSPPEILNSLGYRELKGLQTTLRRTMRDARLPGPYRAATQQRLYQVEKLLGTGSK